MILRMLDTKYQNQKLITRATNIIENQEEKAVIDKEETITVIRLQKVMIEEKKEDLMMIIMNKDSQEKIILKKDSMIEVMMKKEVMMKREVMMKEEKMMKEEEE